MSLYCKTKINTPTMYDVPNKDAMKYEIMPHLSVAKRGQVSKCDRAEVIPCGFHKLKTAGRWQITSAFSHDAVPIVRGSMPCNRSRWRS